MQFRKEYKILLKILIILLSYVYIIEKIINLENRNVLLNAFQNLNNKEIILIIFVFLLLFDNWGFEAIKWWLLINKIQKINILKAFQAILSGITVGIFTPNRIGDFGGRILVLKPENRIQGILATLISNAGQLSVILLFGLLSLIQFYPLLFQTQNDYLTITKWHYILTCFLIAIFLFILFNLNLVEKTLLKIPILSKYIKYVNYISSFTRNDLFKILILSIIRHIIYTCQFYLLLRAFDINISFITGFISISLIFLFLTIIPKFTIADLGIRGSLSIFVLGFFSQKVGEILIVSIMIWLINIVIPAVVGSIIISKTKI